MSLVIRIISFQSTKGKRRLMMVVGIFVRRGGVSQIVK